MAGPVVAAHVTHEAIEKIGGIGTVLEGLITSPVYQRRFDRTILVGPHPHPASLAEHGSVRVRAWGGVGAGVDARVRARLAELEETCGTPILYGTREFVCGGRRAEVEVVLVDVSRMRTEPVQRLKRRLYDHLGLESDRYEWEWGYEEWVRLAEPAIGALDALLGDAADARCVLFAHEFMGLPTAYRAIIGDDRRYRTLFHAHECGTARRLVETRPGHDTAFYNVLERAEAAGQRVDDVYGDQSHEFRHALVSRSHRCDATLAVGPFVQRELSFCAEGEPARPADVVYNGVPAAPVTWDERQASRRRLVEYGAALLGRAPDLLMTHVARPVTSKGFWRDVQMCDALEPLLAAGGRRGVLFLHTSAGGTRDAEAVRRMNRDHGWPLNHREGYPDLVGPEVGLDRMVRDFNESHRAVRIVLMNQFGWSRELIGDDVPAEMDFDGYRAATDVELGPATYEPFGISPLEPLAAGGLCVVSTASGCLGLVSDVVGEDACENVLVADFTRLDGAAPTMDELLAMDIETRERIERPITSWLAAEVTRRLADGEAARRRLHARGSEVAAEMTWDRVAERQLLPVVDRVLAAEPGRRPTPPLTTTATA